MCRGVTQALWPSAATGGIGPLRGPELSSLRTFAGLTGAADWRPPGRAHARARAERLSSVSTEPLLEFRPGILSEAPEPIIRS